MKNTGDLIREFGIDKTLIILGCRDYDKTLAEKPQYCGYCYKDRWFMANPSEGIWVCSSSECYHGVGQIEYKETIEEAIVKYNNINK